MKKTIHLLITVFVLVAMTVFSCKEKEPVSELTAKLNFFFSIADKQVAFTAMINYGDSFQWDFGDGQTSNEKNPVHVYAVGGIYAVKLSVTGKGGAKEITKEVSLALTNYEMLAGTANMSNGKRWKISPSHSTTDKFAVADQNFTQVETLAPGILGNLGLGLPEVYDDEFVFFNNGNYQHSPKHGGSLAGLVYMMVTTQGAGILKMTPMSQSFGLCYGKFSPNANATFTFAENQDFTIATAYGPMAYRNVMTLDFSGTEFIGFMDFTRKCIVRTISPDRMQLILFVSASEQTILPTHAVWLTFEVVK
jgi:hypothetical protein